MPGIIWRIIIAVVFFLAFGALLPPLMRIFGFSMSGDVETVIHILAGLVAICYIIWGKWPPSGAPV